VVDTSALYAFFDTNDPHHQAVSATIGQDDGPFIISPYVLAELDSFIAERRGIAAELASLDELTSGAWDLPAFGLTDVRRAQELLGSYQDQKIGLADASLVLLADRYRTNRVLTRDHRHFSVLRTISGGAFELLPADSA
jgi:predicted nucleic acid-binding protein